MDWKGSLFAFFFALKGEGNGSLKLRARFLHNIKPYTASDVKGTTLIYTHKDCVSLTYYISYASAAPGTQLRYTTASFSSAHSTVGKCFFKKNRSRHCNSIVFHYVALTVKTKVTLSSMSTRSEYGPQRIFHIVTSFRDFNKISFLDNNPWFMISALSHPNN